MVVEWIFELEEDSHVEKVREIFSSPNQKMKYSMLGNNSRWLERKTRQHAFAIYKYLYIKQKQSANLVGVNQKHLVDKLQIAKRSVDSALTILVYGRHQLLHEKAEKYFVKSSKKPNCYKRISVNKAKAL